MNCAHCDAIDQRGRFCVRCGKTLPANLDTPRRIRLTARPYLTDDMTQPVLRFRQVVQRRSVEQSEETAAAR